MKLSATIICKNEADQIVGCLESIEGVDEIVLCDTGSDDETVKVVKSWHRKSHSGNLKVCHFPWNDHFSDARNFCLTHATGDWCLIIDADERITPDTIPNLRKFIEETPDCPHTLSFLCHAQGSENVAVHHMVRAHQRIPEIRWEGRVHECLNTDSKAIVPGCELIYGHSNSHENDPGRNLRLLRKAYAEDPSSRNLYYLGREYFYRQDYEEAARFFDSAAQKSTWMPERTDAWLLLARCLWFLQRGDDARAACANAILCNADFKEAFLFMAEMVYEPNKSRWLKYAELCENTGLLFVRGD
jgi:glycosyltransferase involved in cell wall biosynthesis